MGVVGHWGWSAKGPAQPVAAKGPAQPLSIAWRCGPRSAKCRHWTCLEKVPSVQSQSFLPNTFPGGGAESQLGLRIRPHITPKPYPHANLRLGLLFAEGLEALGNPAVKVLLFFGSSSVSYQLLWPALLRGGCCLLSWPWKQNTFKCLTKCVNTFFF